MVICFCFIGNIKICTANNVTKDELVSQGCSRGVPEVFKGFQGAPWGYMGVQSRSRMYQRISRDSRSDPGVYYGIRRHCIEFQGFSKKFQRSQWRSRDVPLVPSRFQEGFGVFQEFLKSFKDITVGSRGFQLRSRGFKGIAGS